MPSPFALQELDSYIEYDEFLSDAFDANAYADAIIKQSGTLGRTDVTHALSKLTFSIDSLNKQIHAQVTANYSALLDQVTGIRELESVLASVEANIGELNSSLKRLASKIRTPYQELQTHNVQLENIQKTTDLLRRAHRFSVLIRRLETQLPPQQQTTTTDSSRDVAAAAVTIHEIDTLFQQKELHSLDMVSSETEFIEKCRAVIEDEADRLLQTGLGSGNQTTIAAGLQIFYNMKQLGDKVNRLTNSLLDDLTREIRHAVDMSSLQKEIRGTGSGPAVRRANNEPTFASQAAWTSAIWSRMEALMNILSEGCVKMYELEKVLELKKDSFTHTSFLEEVLQTLDATSIVSRFWRILAGRLEMELKEATKSSAFLRNTLIGDYPKLERLLQEFLSQVALRNGMSLPEFSQSPEYIIMMRSLNSFEHAYKSKIQREITQR